MTNFPSAWDVRPLAEIVDILDSRRIPLNAQERASRPGTTPYYGATGQVGWIDKPIFDEPLILLGEDGVQFFEPNKQKAYLIDGPAWVNNHAHVLRARAAVDRKFLNYYLNAADYQGLANGTTRLKLTQAAMKQMPVPLPGLEEQKRIVDLLEDHLSRLDAADAYLKSANQRLTAMERSALDDLFGGADVSLAHLIDDISAGKSYGGANGPARDDEWGIIKVSAMTWGEFDPLEHKAVPADRVDSRFEIREGDLLVSRANTEEYVGASVLVGEVRPKLLLSDKSLRVTPKAGVQPAWLWRALQAPSARRQITALATGTKESMRNISQESLKKVLLPSATESAQADAVSDFAEMAAATSRMRAELDSAQRRCTALRRALLAAAFSGRLTGDRVLAGV